ncbi:MAG: 4Fe-4S binding protein [Candidatus Omnitrophica bacterium]|nr:4Fe-4S binding protein [Candidatus Omnitrophota bacterium]
MISKRIVLHFPKRLADQPIVYKLVKDYDLKFNILRASITPQEEALMVMELSGKAQDYDKGVEYLKSCGLTIQSLSHDVLRNDQKCTDCGVCIPICPVGALEVDVKTRKVNFHSKKCIACEFCIKICPTRAMELHF